MFEKRSTEFTRKHFVGSCIFSSFILIISLMQIVFMWISPGSYSLFFISSRGIPDIALKILSVLIFCMYISIAILLFVKSLFWRKRRFFLRNHFWTFLIMFSTTIIPFAIPNILPVNFILPITFLFTTTTVFVAFK